MLELQGHAGRAGKANSDTLLKIEELKTWQNGILSRENCAYDDCLDIQFENGKIVEKGIISIIIISYYTIIICSV